MVGKDGTMDSHLERALLGIAHALFLNRLHVLRLTEVVRLGVRPDKRREANLAEVLPFVHEKAEH